MMFKNGFLIIAGVFAIFVVLVFVVWNVRLSDDSDEFEKIIMSNPEIKMAYCEIVGYCGDVAAVDCGAERDGPLFYVNKYSGKILEYCGGYCMGGPKEGKYCINCPPNGWDC